MRYRFIDHIVSLALGEAPRIEVTKAFAPGDDAFTGPAGDRRVPESLLLELMAMTGGQLAFRHLGEHRLPLLLKATECRFEGVAQPGVNLRAVAALRGASAAADGASVVEAATEVFAGAERIAAAILLYVCVALPGVDLVAHAERP
jgi:3-hydroxymyristoyl/3-hydroxydecanoyl-(acyl carrier protein) dehydratase